MRAWPLSVEGAFKFEIVPHEDDRGAFLSPYGESVFESFTGHPLFTMRQHSYSTSRRGVVRGLHYTATPPGAAKYVYSPVGEALDIVLDIRAGSPTFGQWDSVRFSAAEHYGVYLPVGVAHMFAVLADDTVISYLLSAEYRPADELAISPLDPALGLPLPDFEHGPVLSARDRDAPTLAEARAAGRLPQYARAAVLERQLGAKR
ncbi:MAG TPA: dTDP-4-dehydrorhamnose 3,5-epimerase family protein [Amycolatopsis sp.]